MDHDDQPPSPARSVASVASTAFSERVAKVPAVIASKSKEELQHYVLELLKKLRTRDKKLEDLSTALQKAGAAAASSNTEAPGSASKTSAQLKDALEQVAQVTARAEAAEAALAKANAQLDALVLSSRESALSHDQQLRELQEQLQASQAELEAADRRAQESQENSAAVKQQLASIKDALKSMSEEREEAFQKLGDYKEQAAELKEQAAELKEQAAELKADNARLTAELEQQQAQQQQHAASLQATVDELQAKLAAAEQQAAANDEQVNQQAASELAAAVQRAAELESELAAVKQEVEGLQAQVDDGTAQVVELQSQLAASTDKAAALEAQLADASAGQGALETSEAELQAAREQLAAAQQEIQELQAQLKSAQSDADGAGSETAAVKEQLAASQDQVADLQSQIESHKDQMTALDAQIESSQTQLASVQSLLTASEEQVEALQAQVAAAAAAASATEQDGSAAIQQAAELAKVIQELDALKSELAASKVAEQEAHSLSDKYQAVLAEDRESVGKLFSQLQQTHTSLLALHQQVMTDSANGSNHTPPSQCCDAQALLESLTHMVNDLNAEVAAGRLHPAGQLPPADPAPSDADSQASTKPKSLPAPPTAAQDVSVERLLSSNWDDPSSLTVKERIAALEGKLRLSRSSGIKRWGSFNSESGDGGSGSMSAHAALQADLITELKARILELEQQTERVEDMHEQLVSELSARMAQLAEKDSQLNALDHASMATVAALEEAEGRAAESQHRVEELEALMQGGEAAGGSLKLDTELQADNERLKGQVAELVELVEHLQEKVYAKEPVGSPQPAALPAGGSSGTEPAATAAKTPPRSPMSATKTGTSSGSANELQLFKHELTSRAWQLEELHNENQELHRLLQAARQQVAQLRGSQAGAPAVVGAGNANGDGQVEEIVGDPGAIDVGDGLVSRTSVKSTASGDVAPADAATGAAPAAKEKGRKRAPLFVNSSTNSNPDAAVSTDQEQASGADPDAVAADTASVAPSISTDKLQQLSVELEEKSDAFTQQCQQLSDLHAEVASLTSRLEAVSETEIILNHQMNLVQDLRQQLLDAVADIEARDEQVRAAESASSQLQSQLTEQQEALSQVQAKLKEAEAAAWKLEEMEATLEELQQECDSKQADLKAAHAEVKQLKAAAAAASREAQPAADPQAEQVLQAEIDKLQAEMQAAKEAAAATAAELESKVQALEAELSRAQQQAEAQGQQAEAAGELSTELEAVRAELGAVREQSAAAEEGLRQELADAINKAQQLEEELQGSQAELVQAKQVAERLERSQAAAGSETDSKIQELVQELETAQQAVETARQELSSVQVARDELSEELALAGQRLEAAVADAVAAARDELQGKLDAALAEATAAQHELQEVREELQRASAAHAEVVEQAAAAASAATAASTSQEASVSESQAQLVADNAQLTKEVGDLKKKLLVLAKKKSAEHAAAIKALEAQVASLTEQAGEVQGLKEQLQGLEQQLAEAKADLEAARQQLSARVPEEQVAAAQAEGAKKLADKERELTSAQSLLSEYKSLVGQRDGTIAKLEEAMKKLEVDKELAVSKVRSQLHDKEVEMESLHQQLLKAEGALANAQRAGADAASATVSELAQAKADLEAAKLETQAVRKEFESEKARLTKAVEDVKKRLNKATKAQHAAELAAAEARGKSEADVERHKLEVAFAHQSADALKLSVERAEAELKDYKSRAQALLRNKDLEIKALKDASAAVPAHNQEELSQLQTALAEARTAAQEAAAALAAAQQEYASQLAAATAAAEQEVGSMQSRLALFQQAAMESGREVEELRNRCEALEARIAHHQGADQQAAQEAKQQLQNQVASLESQLSQVQAQAATNKAATEALLEAKDEEVLQLARKVTLAQEEVTALKQQLLITQVMRNTPISDTYTAPAGGQAAAAASTGPATLQPANSDTQSATVFSSKDTGLFHNQAQGGSASHPEEPTTPTTPQGPVPSSALDAETAQAASQSDILGSLIQPEASKQLLDADPGLVDPDGLPVSLNDPSHEVLDERDASNAAVGLFGVDGLSSISQVLGFGGAAQEDNGKQLEAAGSVTNSLESQVAELSTALEQAKAKTQQLEAEIVELEREVALREEMEQALKESLREVDRSMQRQTKGASHVDAEYLKNTVLKMYRTGEAEALLPVFGTILCFSRDEMNSCKEGLRRIQQGEVPLPTAAAVVDTSLNVISSLSSWTAWALGGNTATTTPSEDVNQIGLPQTGSEGKPLASAISNGQSSPIEPKT